MSMMVSRRYYLSMIFFAMKTYLANRGKDIFAHYDISAAHRSTFLAAGSDGRKTKSGLFGRKLTCRIIHVEFLENKKLGPVGIKPTVYFFVFFSGCQVTLVTTTLHAILSFAVVSSCRCHWVILQAIGLCLDCSCILFIDCL